MPDERKTRQIRVSTFSNQGDHRLLASSLGRFLFGLITIATKKSARIMNSTKTSGSATTESNSYISARTWTMYRKKKSKKAMDTIANAGCLRLDQAYIESENSTKAKMPEAIPKTSAVCLSPPSNWPMWMARESKY